MKHAILAAEDERFYQPWRRRLPVRAARAPRQPLAGPQQGAGHDHHAGRPQLLPHAREDRHAQAARGAARRGRSRASLTKDEILELYVNQIFLGPAQLRLRGAARTYYRQAAQRAHRLRKPAMLAGLPEGSLAYNPVTEPEAREDPTVVRAAADA
jgi:penicillin-binding protein 1A